MAIEHEHEDLAGTPWRRFWNRGGWWKALGLAAVYVVVYQGFGFLANAIGGSLVDRKNLFSDPASVFFGLGFAILLGGVVLIAFVWSVGWIREIFGPQPLKGRGWMWIAVALLVIPIVLRLAGTDWGAYSVAVVLTTLLTGVFIGFAEELLTRGLAVNLLRRGGYGEKAVMVLSSLIFALLHSVNAFVQAPLTVALTVVYTFGFGMMMYLVLRVTGSIIWPMLLHAATDPTTFLATGGVDAHSDTAGSAALLGAAGSFNILYILFGVVAIFLVKGRVYPDRARTPVAATSRAQ